jgi:hypothetical protein
MLTPDYLFWFGAGLLATEPLSCRGGWLYAPPVEVSPQSMETAAMVAAIPNGTDVNGTDVWMAVPASPPLRMTILARLDDRCDECRLPVYRCESEGGQMLRLSASHLRMPN